MIYALIDSTSRKLVMLPIRVTLANEEREHIATAVDYTAPRSENSSGRVRVDVRDSVGALMYEHSYFPHIFGFKIVRLCDQSDFDALVKHNELKVGLDDEDDDSDALTLEVKTIDSNTSEKTESATLSPSDARALAKRAREAGQSVTDHLMTVLLEAIDADVFERGGD
jgi:hypothetical protein